MRLSGENTIITSDMAKSNLDNYANKNNKISRDIKSKKLFRIIRGLYETNKNTPAYLLAGSIYGPSYISFEYALSYYGLIPERVTTVTCATFNKKKKIIILIRLLLLKRLYVISYILLGFLVIIGNLKIYYLMIYV